MAGPKPIIPEVLEPEATLPRDLIALTRFARLMDEAVRVPGTKRRVGLDAGLGLIPGIGDTVAALLSAWIIIGALRWRVPHWRVARMVLYVVIDLAFGTLPVIGIVLDWLFEENVINLKSLLRYRDRQRPPRRLVEVAGAAIVVVLVILCFALLVITALLTLIIWIVHRR